MDHLDYFLAVDLGATSGRTLLGCLSGGRMEYEELTRFDNSMTVVCHHVYWDIYALYGEIIRSLCIVSHRGIVLKSIGIDSWGVDFVCIGSDGAPLRNPLSYRDPHTEGVMEEYFSRVMDRRTLYEHTGIQFMNFNSLFQLYAMRRSGDSALEHAQTLLFMPDALIYMLTGERVCEYTIASTSQMMNPYTHRLDPLITESVGVDVSMFGREVQPGTVVGTLSAEVQRLTGLGAVPVVAVAGHDTASAVAAVPASDPHFAYLSSGTWSLMGIESPHAVITEESYLHDFTNEGGIDGTTRFLKNITGMWIYERCRREWTDAPATHGELLEEAFRQPSSGCFINPDSQEFANPESMTHAFSRYCISTGQAEPQGYAAVCRTIFESLALRYKQVFSSLLTMTPFDIDVLHIIGGGSKNHWLNQFTANALGIEVIAGPQECTAIGNIMVQAKAAGIVGDVWEMRRIIADSVATTRYMPVDTAEWELMYGRYLEITNL